MTVHVRVRVGAEHYALAVGSVREIVDAGEVAPVPGAHSAVVGVRNVHGQVVPVIDLGRVLGASGTGLSARVVVVEDGGRLAGLAVDAVTGVQSIPEATEEVQSPHLTGAALDDGVLVGIVDVGLVLDHVQTEYAK